MTKVYQRIQRQRKEDALNKKYRPNNLVNLQNHLQEQLQSKNNHLNSKKVMTICIENLIFYVLESIIKEYHL